MTTKHINLRLAPDLHSWLVNAAAREKRSVNGYIEWRLEQERDKDHQHGNAHSPRPEVREGGR